MISLEADVSFECFYIDNLINIFRNTQYFSNILGFNYSYSQMNLFTSFYDKNNYAFNVHLNADISDSYLIKNELPDNIKEQYLNKDFLKEHNLNLEFIDINIPRTGNINIIQEIFENLFTICLTTEYFVPIYLEDVIIRIDYNKVYGKDKDFTNLTVTDEFITQYRNNMTTKFAKQKYNLLREHKSYDDFVNLINQYKQMAVQEKDKLTITKTKRKTFVFD